MKLFIISLLILSIFSFSVFAAIPTLTVSAPENNKGYTSKTIPINISSDQFSLLEYSIDYKFFTRLCINCNHFDKSRIFQDGIHSIKFRSVNEFNETSNIPEINFTIDTQKPRVFSIDPRSGKFTNGMFTVKYIEEKLKEINLLYRIIPGTVWISVPANLSQCRPLSKNLVTCNFKVNLTSSDNQFIEYYANIKNTNNEANSSKNFVKVDITKPNITIYSPVTAPPYAIKNILVNITSNEDVRLTFSLDSTPERLLCTKCKSFIQKMKFNSGIHLLHIKGIDLAGNIDEKEVAFIVL